jgi:hypothetical protein
MHAHRLTGSLKKAGLLMGGKESSGTPAISAADYAGTSPISSPSFDFVAFEESNGALGRIAV